MLKQINVSVFSHVLQLGSARSENLVRPQTYDLEQIDESPVRCFNAVAEAKMIAEIENAAKDGDSLGGIFEVASRRGSNAHDAIIWNESESKYSRETSLAGGTEGGMSTGEMLVVRAAMKPLATLNRPSLKTVDTVTKQETVSFKERTDVTAVPAMGVVAETMVALVLAQEAQRNFGGDSIDDFVRNATSFAKRIS